MDNTNFRAALACLGTEAVIGTRTVLSGTEIADGVGPDALKSVERCGVIGAGCTPSTTFATEREPPSSLPKYPRRRRTVVPGDPPDALSAPSGARLPLRLRPALEAGAGRR
ncbi:hypothetical protein [Jannaschia formosa]|uniref:hypothetical protein n=1 Tax=Jannaschia formosa TaxID=2259592 RepID=UPI00107518D8|nr:hypothetical protein [Jannaschia formosa]TFL19621.1 hypothetical protein DR046_03725 [Jannaschia formosa]